MDVAMMSRRCFLLFLGTCRGFWLNYTPLKNRICTCFWEPDRIILQRFFLYQSWKKVPCLWFQHFSCRLIKNRLSTKEKEQCWEEEKNLSSENLRGKRGKGAGSKRNPLYKTAAWPAFFQGSAINKAAAGSPVLLFFCLSGLWFLIWLVVFCF